MKLTAHNSCFFYAQLHTFIYVGKHIQILGLGQKTTYIFFFLDTVKITLEMTKKMSMVITIITHKTTKIINNNIFYNFAALFCVIM